MRERVSLSEAVHVFFIQALPFMPVELVAMGTVLPAAMVTRAQPVSLAVLGVIVGLPAVLNVAPMDFVSVQRTCGEASVGQRTLVS